MACSHASVKKSIRELQLIKNTAARVLTNIKKVKHITPIKCDFTNFYLALYGSLVKYMYMNGTECLSALPMLNMMLSGPHSSKILSPLHPCIDTDTNTDTRTCKV